MTKRRQKRIAALLISVLCLVAAQYANQRTKFVQKVAEIPVGYYQVTEFVDGDTFAINMDGTTEKVRLIGVDTPETHRPNSPVQCFGTAASDFTKNLIGTNPVRLEADPTNSNRDRYQRLLRYAYLPDGRLVNAEIIKQGYGFAYVNFPFLKLEEFRGYEDAAESASLGLWANCSITDLNGRGQTNDLP